MSSVAALFVRGNGPYASCPGVDVWPVDRDARTYQGRLPVVAHPPCERWGKYWFGSPSRSERHVRGDDDGCFASALESVRRWGGVLEHPRASSAFALHGLNSPPDAGGWVNADFLGGWCCRVDQGRYGHRAQKATWLLVYGCLPPSLDWSRAGSIVEVEKMGRAERERTPDRFRDLLLSIARACI